MCLIWRSTVRTVAIPKSKWKIAGVGMLLIICFFNLYEAFIRIPIGMPDSAIQSGILIRELFENGTLSPGDKVLVEVESKNYKGMQVMSNHPHNFVLDRDAYRTEKDSSFFLDSNTSPHGIGVFYTDYQPQTNPFLLDPKANLGDYFEKSQIRLAIIKNPKIVEMINKGSRFRKIQQVESYGFFLAPGIEDQRRVQ